MLRAFLLLLPSICFSLLFSLFLPRKMAFVSFSSLQNIEYERHLLNCKEKDKSDCGKNKMKKEENTKTNNRWKLRKIEYFVLENEVNKKLIRCINEIINLNIIWLTQFLNGFICTEELCVKTVDEAFRTRERLHFFCCCSLNFCNSCVKRKTKISRVVLCASNRAYEGKTIMAQNICSFVLLWSKASN